jgi:hypothetical protein
VTQEWETFARVIGVLIPAAAALLGFVRGPNALRSRLKHDAETLDKLPKDSEAHRALLEHIRAQVSDLRRYETVATRHWPSLIGALVFAPLTGYATVWLIQRTTWGGFVGALLCGFLTITLAYGIFEAGQRAPETPKENACPSTMRRLSAGPSALTSHPISGRYLEARTRRLKEALRMSVQIRRNTSLQVRAMITSVTVRPGPPKCA